MQTGSPSGRSPEIDNPNESEVPEKAPSPIRTSLLTVKRIILMIGVIFLYIALSSTVNVVVGMTIDCQGALTGLNSAVGLLAGIIALLLIWKCIAGHSFISNRPLEKRKPREIVALVVAIVLLGFGIQLILGLVVTNVLTALPDLDATYEKFVPTKTETSVTVLSFIGTAALAPLAEELLVRGIIMELLLRIFCPSWRKGQATPNPTKAALIAVIIIQALIFGLIHANPVQSVYASLLGILLGWACWRTGKLRYCIAIHAAVNAFNFLPFPLDPLDPTQGIPMLVSSVALMLIGWALFRRATERRGNARTSAQ